MTQNGKITTFLAEIDPNIYEAATVIPARGSHASPLGLIEPNKEYIVTIKDVDTFLGRNVFVYVSVHLNSNFTINFMFPKHKIDRYIWKNEDKAAKILYSSK